MSEFVIEKGIVVDDAEAALNVLRQVASTDVTGMDTVRKFVTGQKATKFYVDDRAAVKMAPERGVIYLWIDTGFVDKYGNPVFISLLKNGESYSGHIVGTAKTLAKGIIAFFPRNKQYIDKNIGDFRAKYDKKISCRAVRHIENEEKYFINSCNDEGGLSDMARQLANLHIVYEDAVEELIEEEPEAEPEETLADWSAEENEITLGILLDKIDEMQAYIRELLHTIEELSTESNEKIVTLQKKNAEYEQSLKQIREFMISEEADREAREKEKEYHKGHELIARKGKILVLGATEISKTDMQGIFKTYGFEKGDVDYELDYSKVVSVAGRITTEGRYCAIIFGACPHKASETNGWSSLIEKYKAKEDGPVAIDARTNSGKLKVTKDSFKKALLKMCEELSNR